MIDTCSIIYRMRQFVSIVLRHGKETLKKGYRRGQRKVLSHHSQAKDENKQDCYLARESLPFWKGASKGLIIWQAF